MVTSESCPHCTHDIPSAAERCPHCSLPGRFPNVRAAEEHLERSALETRYNAALDGAKARGCEGIVKDLQATVENRARAVLGRPVSEVHRLATSDNQLYATYYQLIESEVRLPSGDKWDVLRRVAEETLFPGYKERIRFAALALDSVGVLSYGQCFCSLRVGMTSHRASLLEENSVLFMGHHNILMIHAHNPPRGYRAAWDDRGKLCVAKLAGRITDTTQHHEFPGLLVRQGATSADDDFVEVHVYGPLSIRTIETVVLVRARHRPSKAIVQAMVARLQKAGVAFEVR
jgi:hypothetical protein